MEIQSRVFVCVFFLFIHTYLDSAKRCARAAVTRSRSSGSRRGRTTGAHWLQSNWAQAKSDHLSLIGWLWLWKRINVRAAAMCWLQITERCSNRRSFRHWPATLLGTSTKYQVPEWSGHIQGLSHIMRAGPLEGNSTIDKWWPNHLACSKQSCDTRQCYYITIEPFCTAG